ncbi:SDR family NAD(P)-dependent oxidoreductase [Brevundimonas sp.]|uniref:SDR family NAD(P)-dependent oxidoreductase n=2 Tax=Brevundimonas TaxID=41275 RepID=UPI0017FAA373|nr:SDR family NAD(P)-dependent oxidoreductase [Brevundimonas sp.]MBA4806899.1 SDR family NAD(P)-dependent oxidoreductase [Brevundimonas sp.]
MSHLDFEGRVALITGAGSGMGREHALLLAQRGARVVVNDIAGEKAETVARMIVEAGGEAVADTHDIITGAAALVETAIDAFGRLDVVINNAGISRFGRFWETEPEAWWHVFDTHFRGAVEVSRHAFPHLIASGSGRLINISSSAMLGAPQFSAYGAAKAAIWGLGNALAIEGRDVGVQVTTVQPSAWTPMTEDAFDNPAIKKVLREKLPPAAVSAFVAWLAHQDTRAYGGCFQTSGAAAGRGVFAAYPRVLLAESTPEAWAEAADALEAGGALTPLTSTSESFRAELVFLDPSMEDEIPRDAADVTKRDPG